jgi:hypothetical protein
MSEPDRLTADEQYVLCWWSVQALAEELLISEDAAEELLEAAYARAACRSSATTTLPASNAMAAG